MSTIYLKDLQKTEEQMEYLKREYSNLWERYNQYLNEEFRLLEQIRRLSEMIRKEEQIKKIWEEINKIKEKMKPIQNEIEKIHGDVREIEYYKNSLKPEIIKALRDADRNTLNKIYERCYEKRVPKGVLTDAIEKEIYHKYFIENNIKADHIYKLKKFVNKKKY